MAEPFCPGKAHEGRTLRMTTHDVAPVAARRTKVDAVRSCICLCHDGAVKKPHIRRVGDKDARVPSDDVEVCEENLLDGLDEERWPDLFGQQSCRKTRRRRWTEAPAW